MAAAVEGSDAEDSWFTGTIVQVGSLVNALNHRHMILGMVLELEVWADGGDVASVELQHLRERIEELPTETPEPLRVGDRVCFSWAAGQQITMDGERYLILHASEVLAVLEENT